MNLSLAKINSLFPKNREKNFLYIKKYLNPKADWFKIVISFFIIFVLVIVFSVYFYLQISRGNFFREGETEENIDKSVVINQTSMVKIINNIDLRKSTRDNLNIGIPTDPSI